MTYDEALRLYRDGLGIPLELANATLADLTLDNVHERLGIEAVERALAGVGSPVSAFSSPASDSRKRSLLVLRTWRRHPPGGWLRWPASWERLRELEKAVDAGLDLSAHLADPDPVVRLWAVVGCDGTGDVAHLDASLDDDDPEVALLAAAALLRRGLDSPRVRGLLVRLLDLEDHWWDAARLVGPLHEPAAATALMSRYHQGHKGVLEWLGYPEALPTLEEELIERSSWAATQAVVALGPKAAPMAQVILARLSRYADEEPVLFETVVPGITWWVLPHEQEASKLFDALNAIGLVGDGAAETLTRWALRPAVGHGDFERRAAEVICTWSDAGRQEVAQLLAHPDEAMRVRALVGLAAGGPASAPWRDEVGSMVDDPSNDIAFSAAVALAAMGDTRAARDAWLSYEAWPLRHHGTPMVLHLLSRLLIRDLPALGSEATDSEDFRRTRLALETLAPDQSDPVRIIVLEGDPLDAERAFAAETLRQWRGLE